MSSQSKSAVSASRVQAHLSGAPHAQDARSPLPDLPDPQDLVLWHEAAKARVELVMSDFDADLVSGVDPSLAADRCVGRFMSWSRRSAAGLVTVRGTLLIDEGLRSKERAYWDRLARDAICQADGDPNGVERFLRLWLAVVHESVSTGYASLHADPTAW